MGGSAGIERRNGDRQAAERPGRRFLLIVSEDDRYVSPCLVQAIQHEFPWLDVLSIASIEQVCTIPVRVEPLLLIDFALCSQYEAMIDDLQRAHPHAAVAFLAKGARVPAADQILCLSGVRGVLPMSLALDVWLAALRVLILGGEYFSAAFLLAAVQSRSASSEPHPPLARGEETPTLRGLTARELQILDLVSRGQQNKLIAAALRLSENTVKIHIHHIIAKLGVHNRTEAAGFYLEMPKSVRERALSMAAAGGGGP